MPRKARTEAATEAVAARGREKATNLDSPAARSAWFVFGSDESLLTNYDLAEIGGKPHWTVPKNAEIGDILFFYFIAPEQSVHFMARVASQPVRELWNRGGYQYWAKCDSMIRIEPIHLSKIREILGEERLLMYCPGGRYIRPDLANRLIQRGRPTFWISMRDLDKVLCEVVGRNELGEPSTITLAGVRGLVSESLNYEEEVEYHVLEPLLRLAQLDNRVRIQRRFDLPKRRTADYAVIDRTEADRTQRVLCIIEAKLNLGKGSNWLTNPHVKRAREYAEMCNAPSFVVMDRDRIVCFRTPDSLPCLALDRATLDENGLSALRAHILNQEGGHPSHRQGHQSSVTHRRRRGGDA